MTINKGSSGRQGLNRRSFLKASAGTAALLGAVNTQFPFGAHIAQAAGPEVTKALLGFIALTDAAPLFVAKEKGIFAKYGVPDVEVQKQASWGATRDNLVLGSEGNGIDGAHILTPMPYLISAGKVTQNNVPTPMYILARLNLNGQFISVG
jgi:nitrate/nitrite transport system substrate-binding protein